MNHEADLRRKIVRLGALLYDRRLAHGSAGNLSVRLEDGGYLVTPTNVCLGMLEPDRLSRLSAAGELIDGDPPSKESFFHLAIYEERPAARAIIHLHATYSAAVSCLCHPDPANVLPPMTAYQVMRVGPLPLVGYFRPGDRRLAEAVRRTARNHRAMLLANHGPVVSGPDLEGAIYASEELEETAKIFLLLQNAKPHCLNAEQIEELKVAFKLDI